MSSQKLLMDINAPLFPHYNIKLGYSEANLPNKIEEVASFVSKVYAKFPKLDEEKTEQLRKAGFYFNKDKKIASASECEQFEIALKERIIKDLNQNRSYGYSIELLTDYSPGETLAEVAEPIFQNIGSLGPFFPYKSITTINLDVNKKKLRLSMQF